MSLNIWKKRYNKLKGALIRGTSYLFLRHTSFNRKHLEGQVQKLSINKLHMGCGDVILDGWLNVTYEVREEYGRIVRQGGAYLLNYNLLKEWPIEDNSMDFIAGSHIIEHFDLNRGIQLAKKSYDKLKSGGILRLSCPDLEIYAKNYVDNNREFFHHELIQEWCTFDKAKTSGEIFAAKAYDSGYAHKWFYDFDSLKHILELAGFQDIQRCQRLEGKVPDLENIELPLRELETVYVEAIKR